MMNTTPSIRIAVAADAEMLAELARRIFYDAFAPMNRLVVMGEFRHNILISQTLAVSRGGLLIWEREATNL